MTKTSGNDKALALYEEGTRFPAVMSDGPSSIMADCLGSGAQAFDLTRIKIPTGGGNAWNVETPEGIDSIKDLRGVILFAKFGTRAWWASTDPSGEPPSCSSDDGKVGFGVRSASGNGEPTRQTCASCQWNQWGSKRGNDESRAKDCKEAAFLFFLREGQHVPSLIVVPPSSLKSLRRYIMALASGGVSPWTVISELGLAPAQSGTGINYSQIAPAMVEKIPEPMHKAFTQARDMVAETLATRTLDLQPEDVTEA